jgi:hypothetical protein
MAVQAAATRLAMLADVKREAPCYLTAVLV